MTIAQRKHTGSTLFWSAIIFLLIGSCYLAAAPEQKKHTAQVAGASHSSAHMTTSIPCSPALTFNSNVPGDGVFLNQSAIDCFAWSEFIPLNWPTQGSVFGAPGIHPVQWETYITQEELYPSNGGASVRSAKVSLPSSCKVQITAESRAKGAIRILRATSKFSADSGANFNFPEAFPNNGPAWLGAQNGTNVWYEVLLNPGEQDYVTSNKFYNASNQASWVNNGNGNPIVFPKGSSSPSQVGTIELKAAWMEVPNYDPSNAKWQQYLLSKAVVIGPSNNQCRPTVVALVGLHIIHKTQSQPTWIWATFEHVDNVVGPNNTPNCCNFSSQKCTPQQVTVSQSSCLASGQSSPVTVSCTANTSPPYNLGPGCPNPVPIQVQRTTPLNSTALGVDATAWSAIQAQNPASVFQYYQLVDVLWSTNPTQDPTKPQKVPLNPASLTSGNPGTVANTTLETYIQTSQCTDCHRYANIAPQTPPPPPVWDSDFSFAFGTASVGASQASHKSAKH